MKNKIITVSVLLSVFCLVGFAFSAYYPNEKKGSIIISKGWNLIPIAIFELEKTPDSTVNINGLKYGYFYDRNSKKYILFYKDGRQLYNPDNSNGSWFEGDEDMQYALRGSFWAYSENEGILNFKWNPANKNLFNVNNYKLKKGWNFLFVTPEMAIGTIGVPSTARSLNDINGKCVYEKIYSYKTNQGGWVNLINSLDNKQMLSENSAQMYGLVIKVPDDCLMAVKDEILLPPQIPN